MAVATPVLCLTPMRMGISVPSSTTIITVLPELQLTPAPTIGRSLPQAMTPGSPEAARNLADAARTQRMNRLRARRQGGSIAVPSSLQVGCGIDARAETLGPPRCAAILFSLDFLGPTSIPNSAQKRVENRDNEA